MSASVQESGPLTVFPNRSCHAAFMGINPQNVAQLKVNERFGLTAPIEEEMPYWLNLEPIPSMLPSWDERAVASLSKQRSSL